MRKIAFNTFLWIAVLVAGMGYIYFNSDKSSNSTTQVPDQLINDDTGGPEPAAPHPLSIESLRNGEHAGSDLVVEQTLPAGSNYSRSIVSYRSEGLKIYALLTIPNGTAPEGGWPAIVFNHGYIPPAEYRTTERYIAYTDAFSRSGYILLRPDYRGHGNSEGQAAGGYGTNNYSIDVLNALASLKKHPSVNTQKMGMWGHSMGGHITLRNMVVSKDIKAGVIWAGVVASYPDLITSWRRRSPQPMGTPGTLNSRSWRQSLIQEHGEPNENDPFWQSISANSYLNDISGPLQLHHGTADTSVPVEFSQKLDSQMKAANQPVETFIYPGDDHNLVNNLGIALQRSVRFFDEHLK
jgi:dipeptidyl aminopeptidase/acylaminoacyl peptidase